MDPNAAPWRSLEAEAPAAEERPPSQAGIPLPAIAAAAGAVVLAVAAFFLAMGSGGGSLVVAGGEPLPSASGDVALQPAGRSELVVEIVGAVTRPASTASPQAHESATWSMPPVVIAPGSTSIVPVAT